MSHDVLCETKCLKNSKNTKELRKADGDVKRVWGRKINAEFNLFVMFSDKTGARAPWYKSTNAQIQYTIKNNIKKSHAYYKFHKRSY